MATSLMAIARFILLGVAIGVVLTDQSEIGSPDDQMEGTGQGKGQIETPAVVLQLKYDRGELNRIYLAQFRNGKAAWSPSVEARTNLCTDLCHSGLGGEACGPTCEDMMPIGLKSALINATHGITDITTSEWYGEPRVDVCPSLCANQLGQPLCKCSENIQNHDQEVNWGAICGTFCVSDNYVLRGCPACEKISAPPVHVAHFSGRTLNTDEGWAAWCNAQCRQGHGGAACNCDRAPL